MGFRVLRCWLAAHLCVACGAGEPAGAIGGMVLGPRERLPIEGVAVRAFAFGGARVAEARTDARGRFVLRHLRAGGVYLVAFSHPDWLLPLAWTTAGTDDAPAQLDPPVLSAGAAALDVLLTGARCEGQALVAEVVVRDPETGAVVDNLDRVPGVFRGRVLRAAGDKDGYPIPSDLIDVVPLPGSAGYRLRVSHATRFYPSAGLLEITATFPGSKVQGSDAIPYAEGSG